MCSSYSYVYSVQKDKVFQMRSFSLFTFICFIVTPIQPTNKLIDAYKVVYGLVVPDFVTNYGLLKIPGALFFYLCSILELWSDSKLI